MSEQLSKSGQPLGPIGTNALFNLEDTKFHSVLVELKSIEMTV